MSMLGTSTSRGDDLIVLGAHRPLKEYAEEVWARRHFAFALANNDLRAKHMSSVLGQLWHLLNPAMMIAVYFVIFGVVLDARRGIDNYITFLVTGVIIFRFVQNTITGCSRCISSNLGLIRSIQFPRALVPISEVLEHLMASVPALALVLVVAVIDGVPIAPRMLALPLVVLGAAIFSLGAGFIAARAGSVMTDLQQVLPHFFRIMLYISGVLFSVQAHIENQLVRNLFAMNPLYDIVAAARWSVTGAPIGERVIGGFAIWTVVVFVAGLIYFRRAEHRYGG